MTEKDKLAVFVTGAIVIFFSFMFFFSSDEDDKKEACYRNGYTRTIGASCFGFEDTSNVDAGYLIWKEKNDQD